MHAGTCCAECVFSMHFDLWVTYYIPVRLGHKLLMHYFLGSGGPGVVCSKSVSGHVTSKLCFLHPLGSVSRKLHSGASRARNIDTLFSMPG
jgi:hypothetical protein